MFWTHTLQAEKSALVVNLTTAKRDINIFGTLTLSLCFVFVFLLPSKVHASVLILLYLFLLFSLHNAAFLFSPLLLPEILLFMYTNSRQRSWVRQTVTHAHQRNQSTARKVSFSLHCTFCLCLLSMPVAKMVRTVAIQKYHFHHFSLLKTYAVNFYFLCIFKISMFAFLSNAEWSSWRSSKVRI